VSRYYPSLAEFERLGADGALVPVYRRLLEDTLTPVSAFRKVAGRSRHAFLLESVVGLESSARYSFLAAGPRQVVTARGRRLRLEDALGEAQEFDSPDPLQELTRLLAPYRTVAVPGVPPFTGGLVGYAGYDVVRYFEPLPHCPPDSLGLPDLYFMLFDTLVIFDHVFKTVTVVSHGSPRGKPATEAYGEACRRVDEVVEALQQPTVDLADDLHTAELPPPAFTSNFTREAFLEAVRRCKEYIFAGDIFQVVPSQRLRTRTRADPFSLYRALRTINPSPYMFYLQLEGATLVGASPEVMVKVENGRITLRPIAGTYARGRSSAEDEELARRLLEDPKERAEHIMLVDLGRNDVGRVARFNTVTLDEVMVVEKYSHVMHITSSVSGELAEGRTAVDALAACLPAGTLSGAPKVRAMQILDELEPTKRGPYGGAVGYIDFQGNMNTCIAIRTIVLVGEDAYIQAGGGIVADSVPEREYEETLNKAQALLRAISVAEATFAGEK
jgi:anthranilate synthase component 1